MIDTIPHDDCTGCCACQNICPKNCIQMLPDSEGFVHPVVDNTACTHCGLCLTKCPIMHPVEIPPESFAEPHASWSLNEDIRFKSTSGGAFSEIARYIIEKGGVVVGARYTDNHLVEHYMIDNISGIDVLRQSKYIQSSIGLIFRKIKDELRKGKTVAFCGTPCQNAGLYKYLNGKPENLILLDFICRGVNSPKVYLKYLEMLEKKYHSPVSRVWFKNKRYGWNRFSTRIEFKNGKSYVKDRYTDLFMRGYIEFNLYMRPSCHACRFKGKERISDITLADFWGGGAIDESFDPDKGTSLVIVHSKKGQTILDNVSDRLFVSKILDDAVYRGNLCTETPPVSNPNRDAFLKDLDTLPFDKCMRKHVNLRKSPMKLFWIYSSYFSRRIKCRVLPDVSTNVSPHISDLLASCIKKNSDVQIKSVSTIMKFEEGFKYVGAILADNGKIYGIPTGASNIIELDPDTDTSVLFGKLPTDPFKWTNGCCYNGYIYGYPRLSNSLLKINPETRTVELIDLNLDYQGEHHYSGVLCGNTIFQPPRRADHVLCINLDDCRIEKIPLGKRMDYCGAILHYNGLIYCLPNRGYRVMVINPETKEVSFIGDEIACPVYGAATTINGNIYGFSGYGKGMVKVNPENNTVEILFPHTRIESYGTQISANGKLYSIPGVGKTLFEFNPENETLKAVKQFDDRRKIAKWAGSAVTRDGTIWCLPAFGDTILKIEFDDLADEIPVEILQDRRFCTY